MFFLEIYKPSYRSYIVFLLKIAPFMGRREVPLKTRHIFSHRSLSVSLVAMEPGADLCTLLTGVKKFNTPVAAAKRADFKKMTRCKKVKIPGKCACTPCAMKKRKIAEKSVKQCSIVAI
jgi:hypothetical protein